MVSSKITHLKEELLKKVQTFHAGSVSHAILQWQKLTGDKDVLKTVMGLSIEFKDSAPTSYPNLPPDRFSENEMVFLDAEVNRLLGKGIISTSTHEIGEYISPIFLTPKSDGGFRLILNLKSLNGFMPYIHFKMDTAQKFLKLVTKGCFMSKIDLKDAYYSIKIKNEHQKYLKFFHKGILYKFTCLPNGLCSGPRKFTKILKCPLSCLRAQDIIISSYIDDLITADIEFVRCFQNVLKTITMFDSLGFVIHPEKSCLMPSQEIEYLGLVINSVNMTVSLTEKKKLKIIELCNLLLEKPKIPIREVAKLLGYMSFSFIAVEYGKLHYRCLERVKNSALAANKGNYDSLMSLTPKAIADINWWKLNVYNAKNDIYKPSPNITLTTDASLKGWGAVTKSDKTGGLLTSIESDYHINVLELKAIHFGLLSLLPNTYDCHVKILSDNTAAVGCVNNMGSCKSLPCDQVTKDIWSWGQDHRVWLSASHIPGVLNKEADKESRENETKLEWKLNESHFQDVIDFFKFEPEIDLFASRINTQIPKFVSYRPDPEATHVNAFSINWTGLRFYAFPPFSCIAQVIQKLLHEKCVGILIIPDWPSQPWFPQVKRILIKEPFLIPCSNHQLYLPNQVESLHPLQHHLTLLACLVDTRTRS